MPGVLPYVGGFSIKPKPYRTLIQIYFGIKPALFKFSFFVNHVAGM